MSKGVEVGILAVALAGAGVSLVLIGDRSLNAQSSGELVDILRACAFALIAALGAMRVANGGGKGNDGGK